MQEWNRAIELIEADLTAPVDAGALARVALTSEYHFRRMFASLAGMPLSEYIRRRRLTAATGEILAGRTVLEVATRYGYGSAEAFTRAFRALHGTTPSQARRPGAILHSQPQLRFHLRVEGTTDMKHRIISKDAFRLVGRRARVPIVFEGPNPHIERFERSLDPALRPLLEALSDTEPQGLLAVTDTIAHPVEEGGEVDYWRAAATLQAPPDGLDALEVAAGQWVVFDTEGVFPDVLQRLWADAAAEWFPANPYRWAPGPQLLSVQADPGGGTGRGQLWIPIEPAASS
ncbi:AraC family transcriptional regulator [Arthrobacter agilis]|uniref:AraC family transcriptional regulator n=1 Tax=Arthrobacter agilis TaxID=37921 RepID=UPI00277DCB70|nr:AraC family transcriptional regulator [Arthrobacter agilis]MDQ0735109.1 AraC family transcriptional regulator [Arthrobacter agilis]